MKFKYGDRVRIEKGFYAGNAGHIISHRSASLGLGDSMDLYRVLLEIPQTANPDYFARNTSAVTIEIQESEASMPGVAL